MTRLDVLLLLAEIKHLLSRVVVLLNWLMMRAA